MGKGMRAEDSRSAEALARVYFTERHIVGTLVRVAFEKFGPDRVEHYLPGTEQFNQIARHVALTRMATAAGIRNELHTPVAFQRYIQLITDTMHLDWSHELNALDSNCRELVSVLTTVMVEDEEACGLVNGHSHWCWVASALEIEESGITSDLNLLSSNHSTVSDALQKLEAAWRQCAFRSHVRLVSHIVNSHFLTDRSSRPAIRKQLGQCFRHNSEVVRELVEQDVESCRNAIRHLKQVYENKELRRLAHTFLGFYALGDERELQKFVARAGTRTRPNHESRAPSPRMIDNAREWVSSPSRRGAPIGAGELPAQGQTRSKKSHRA